MSIPTPKKPYTPRLIFWELTEGCNLKCRHCRAEASPMRSERELPTQEAYRIIDEIAEVSSPVLILTGGEPLYRSDIYDIAGYATAKGLPVALASNGTLIDDEAAHRIKEAGIRRVSISFDGSSPGIHDDFRGLPGSFDAAMNGVRRLQNYGVPVQFNTTITRHNAHAYQDAFEFARTSGAVALHLFMLVPVGCGLELTDSEMLSAEEYEEMLTWYYGKSQDTGFEVRATCAPHYYRIALQQRKAASMEAVRPGERLAHGVPSAGHERHPGPLGHPGASMPSRISGNPEIAGHSEALGHPKHPGNHGHPGHPGHGGMSSHTKGCLAGTGVFFISHRGIVQPCGYLPMKAGDLKRQTVREVWEESPLFQALRNPAELNGKCGVCEYTHVCSGCRARAYARTGNLMDEEPYCVHEPGRKSR